MHTWGVPSYSNVEETTMITLLVKHDISKEILFSQDFTTVKGMVDFLQAIALSENAKGSSMDKEPKNEPVKEKASDRKVNETIKTITGKEAPTEAPKVNPVPAHTNPEPSKVIRRRDGNDTVILTGLPSAEEISKLRVKKRGFWGQTNPANLLSYVYSIGGQKVTFSAFSFTYLYRTVEGLALNADLKEKVHKFGFSMPKKIVRETGKDFKAIYTLISDNGTRKPIEFCVTVKR